jgi:hypothetical protein
MQSDIKHGAKCRRIYAELTTPGELSDAALAHRRRTWIRVTGQAALKYLRPIAKALNDKTPFTSNVSQRLLTTADHQQTHV